MDLHSRKMAGFTLIELIIVILILGILAINVFINWPGTTINVGGQAQQLANDIRYTQALSMAKAQRFRLVMSKSGYQILDSTGAPITLPTGSKTIIFGHDIVFGTLVNLPNHLIAFDGKGTPYIDTTLPGIPLATMASISITSSSSTNTVFITPQTGRVTVK